MFEIISFFLNCWNNWSAEEGKALHEKDLWPEIHIHELLVVFVHVGLLAFLRKCLPPVQWLKLPLWPYFKGLYQIAAFSHSCLHWLPWAPRKSRICVCCLCSKSLRDITSGFSVQQIKDGKFQTAPSHLFSLLCTVHWNDCAAFRNHFDWAYLE